MGLFMDGDGIPLAFSLFPGNSNKQTSLKPLEKKVLADFGCQKFIYCSDAGLGSENIRECFRILKTDFSARPVYLQNENRIRAHFLICFLSLAVYRFLERKRNYKYTCEELLETLRGTVTKKGAFPNENALLKLLYLRVSELYKKWNKRPQSNWALVRNQLDMDEKFQERIRKYENGGF